MQSLNRYRCVNTKLYCINKREHVTVFQQYPPRGHVTLQEAEHACYICNNVPEKYRDECYATFGVDRKKTERYLKTVQQMETTYKKHAMRDVMMRFFEICADKVRMVGILFAMLLNFLFS